MDPRARWPVRHFDSSVGPNRFLTRLAAVVTSLTCLGCLPMTYRDLSVDGDCSSVSWEAIQRLDASMDRRLRDLGGERRQGPRTSSAFTAQYRSSWDPEWDWISRWSTPVGDVWLERNWKNGAILISSDIMFAPTRGVRERLDRFERIAREAVAEALPQCGIAKVSQKTIPAFLLVGP